MKLNNIHILEADLVLETGLHIGAGDGEIHIGGIDNSVIKHPVSKQPYIPGSSLKGKIRSLLEWRSGAVQEDPLSQREYDQNSGQKQEDIKHILQIFGISADAEGDFQERIGHTRAAFWDCHLCPEYIKTIEDANLLFTEVKSENRINRISGGSDNLRQSERVPAGAVFKFKISLKEFEGDGKTLATVLQQGLKLLEWDSLGGSGSRGYGKVKFANLKMNGEDISAQFAQIQPFEK